MEAKDFEIRLVQTVSEVAEAAALAKVIWNESFAGILTRAQIAYMLEKYQSAPAMQNQIDEQGYEYYMAHIKGEPVGYMGIVAQNGRLMLSKLYLLQEVRGRGEANELFALMEARAYETGCTLLWLTVNRHNARAIAAYKKRGFAIVREQVADIGSGYVMDDYVMEKKLPKQK